MAFWNSGPLRARDLLRTWDPFWTREPLAPRSPLELGTPLKFRPSFEIGDPLELGDPFELGLLEPARPNTRLFRLCDHALLTNPIHRFNHKIYFFSWCYIGFPATEIQKAQTKAGTCISPTFHSEKFLKRNYLRSKTVRKQLLKHEFCCRETVRSKWMLAKWWVGRSFKAFIVFAPCFVESSQHSADISSTVPRCVINCS